MCTYNFMYFEHNLSYDDYHLVFLIQHSSLENTRWSTIRCNGVIWNFQHTNPIASRAIRGIMKKNHW